jgi:hypothetical protein
LIIHKKSSLLRKECAMQVDNVRAFLGRKPFRAFTLTTSAGDRHSITHPEGIAVSPREDAVVLWPAGGGLVLLDFDQIAEAGYPAKKVEP